MTPVNPAVEGLRGDLDSRPPTPTVVGLEKDERDDFLRRENELSDVLAEKESALVAADKLVKELREELTFLKEQEASVSKVGSLFLVFSLVELTFFSPFPQKFLVL
jgi:kinesin family protein 5